MVYTFTVTEQALDTNEAIPFLTDGVTYGSCTCHLPWTTTIQLKHTGLYFVTFNATLSTTETEGSLSAQLQVNGVDYPGALASSGVTESNSLSFSALVKVLPNCCAVPDNLPASITVVNTGVDAIYTNAALTIIKVR